MYKEHQSALWAVPRPIRLRRNGTNIGVTLPQASVISRSFPGHLPCTFLHVKVRKISSSEILVVFKVSECEEWNDTQTLPFFLRFLRYGPLNRIYFFFADLLTPFSFFTEKKKKLKRKRVKFECIDQTTCERWLSVRSPAFSILSKTTKIAIRTMSRGTSYFISVCIRRQVFIKRFPANLSN